MRPTGDQGVHSDYVGHLGDRVADYPEKLRRVSFYDEKQPRHPGFLTDNMALPVTVVAKLYRMRWRVELLFK